MSEMYPSILQPVSINTMSPIFNVCACLTPCGKAEAAPNNTMQKYEPFAPTRRCASSINTLTSVVVMPSRNIPAAAL